MGSKHVPTVHLRLLVALEKRFATLGCGLLALILMMFSLPADSAALLFIANSDSPTHRQFLAQLRQWPADDLLDFDTVETQENRLTGFMIWLQSATPGRKSSPSRTRPHARIGSPSLANLCQHVDVVVAIAGDAAQEADKHCPIPVLTVLTPTSLLNPHFNPSRESARTAIYQEADPAANLLMIRELLPKANTIGVLVSPQQRARLPHLRAEADRLRFHLEEINATNDEEAVRALRKRISTLDALLLLPDLQLINAWSLKPILLMTIRQAVPTFGGPTAEYVRAGVLAAVVADLDRLPAQIMSVAQRLAHGENPAPAYPKATRVIINSTVAGALSISIPSTWNAYAE